ncbi:hypothetical protein QP519_11115 [Weeksella virosa]|uniref:hypothetical protein n=1 Tax=Weeksella virosa TaxID=1014 RepID=UPI002555907A|nr:hypothetical protein [Weeksella virosa]MDK7376081.1 hypothetical protein [Weeksella virosa]MDK7674361.1 hypothetical protein [Weeksella virosa]
MEEQNKTDESKRFVFILEKTEHGEFEAEMTNKIPLEELMAALGLVFSEEPKFKALFTSAIKISDVFNEPVGINNGASEEVVKLMEKEEVKQEESNIKTK